MNWLLLKEKYDKSARKEEAAIIKEINSAMDDFIASVEKVNQKDFGGRKFDINVANIRRKKEKLTHDVVGHIGGVIHDRLTMTDKELSVILKEADDDKRAKNFEKFCEDLFESAKQSLVVEIQKTVAEQQKMVREEITNRIQEIEASMKKAIADYEAIRDMENKSIEEQELMKLQLMYKHGLYEIVGDHVGI